MSSRDPHDRWAELYGQTAAARPASAPSPATPPAQGDRWAELYGSRPTAPEPAGPPAEHRPSRDEMATFLSQEISRAGGAGMPMPAAPKIGPAAAPAVAASDSQPAAAQLAERRVRALERPSIGPATPGARPEPPEAPTRPLPEAIGHSFKALGQVLTRPNDPERAAAMAEGKLGPRAAERIRETPALAGREFGTTAMEALPAVAASAFPVGVGAETALGGALGQLAGVKNPYGEAYRLGAYGALREHTPAGRAIGKLPAAARLPLDVLGPLVAGGAAQVGAERAASRIASNRIPLGLKDRFTRSLEDRLLRADNPAQVEATGVAAEGGFRPGERIPVRRAREGLFERPKREAPESAAAPRTTPPPTTEAPPPTPEPPGRSEAASAPVSQAPADTERQPTPPNGRSGREETSFFPGNGEKVKTRYELVEADQLTPSHNAQSFEPSAGYPAEIQGRAYHGERGRAARESVIRQTERFDPELALDPTASVEGGVPTVTAEGHAVAGNQRVMMIQRLAKEHPEKYAAYRQALEARAEQFGLDPAAGRDMQHPVLVRRIVDPAVDTGNVDVLRRLNASSDVPKGKTKDVLSDASTRAAQLRSSRGALEHFASTIGDDQTIRQYLETADGREFGKRLLQDGVITEGERARYFDATTGTPTQEGKQLLERTLQTAAIGDADVISRAPDNMLRKLDSALPAIVRASTIEGYDLGPQVREALDLLASARANDVKVGDLIAQVDPFTTPPDPRAAAMAQFLEGARKNEVTAAFRGYAEDAAQAGRQSAQAGDLFGYEPPAPEAAARQRFGSAASEPLATERPRIGETRPQAQARRAQELYARHFGAPAKSPVSEPKRALGTLYQREGSARSALVHRNTIPGDKPIRVTWMEEGGPAFHVSFETEGEARNYLANEGYAPGTLPEGTARVRPKTPEASEPLVGRTRLAEPTTEPRAGAAASGDAAAPPLRTPEEQTEDAKRILREMGGRLARTGDVTAAKLAPHESRWEKVAGRALSSDAAKSEAARAEVVRFVDAIEQGKVHRLPEADRAAAQELREAIDQRTAQLKEMDALHTFIENYFPRIWAQPEESVLGRILGRRPLEGSKSFLKKRTVPTFAEGVAAGLEPADWNPLHVATMKLHEMDRFILARRAIDQLKEAGHIRYVRAFEKTPEGYHALDDRAFTVYGSSRVPVWEAFDARVMEGLQQFADALGIKHERLTKLTERGVSASAAGVSTGEGRIQTRFGGPESVLTHEIGHEMDARYGLYRKLATGPEAARELTALAELRYAGREADVAKTFRDYVRTPDEQVANAIHAYVHAPDLMKEVAPTVHERLATFIEAKPELAPLNEIKPSLVLGAGEGDVSAGGMVIRGRYVAPEHVARVINRHLAPSQLQGQGWFRTMRAVSNGLNQFQLLGAFHAGFVSFDSAFSQVALALERAVAGLRGEAGGLARQASLAGKELALAPLSPIRQVIRGNRVMREWTHPGTTTPELTRVVDAIVKGGGRAKMDMHYRTGALRAFRRAAAQGGAGGILKATGLAVPAALEGTMKPLLEWVVPRMKLAAASDLIGFELERMGSAATDKAIGETAWKAWHSVDNRLGQVVYDNLFWNRTAKDIAHLSVRSVGWNLGTLSELGGGAADLAKLVTKGELTHRTAYLVSMNATLAMMGALMTYAMTGKGPTELKDYFFPPTGRRRPDGSADRVSLPTYAKDEFAWANHPLETAAHKTSPVLNLAWEAYHNEDFYGTQIVDPEAPWQEQVKDVARYAARQVTPFSVRGAVQMARSNEPAGRAALSLVGINPAPADITRTAFEGYIGDQYVATLPRGSRSPEEVQRSRKVGRAAYQIRSGERPDLDGLGAAERKRAVQRGRESVAEYRFRRLALPAQVRAWELATPAERDENHLARHLFSRTLAQRLSHLPPDERERVTERLKAIRHERSREVASRELPQ